MRKTRLFVSAIALSCLSLLAPPSAHAQSAGLTATQAPEPSSSSSSFSGPKQQISASPFLVMWKYFNVEYERRATTANTWGLSTSFVPGAAAHYRNLGAFWHFYPGGRALQGFYIGGRVQMHHASALTASTTLGGVGFEMGRNWIVGRRTLVGVGIGATRLFGGPLAGESLTLPTFRIANVGITF